MSRPVKASAQLARRIAALIKTGVRMRDAAEKCGLDGSQIFEYQRRSGPPYDEFNKIINEAIRAGKKPKQAG